jgi:hypothetical protein
LVSAAAHAAFRAAINSGKPLRTESQEAWASLRLQSTWNLPPSTSPAAKYSANIPVADKKPDYVQYTTRRPQVSS